MSQEAGTSHSETRDSHISFWKAGLAMGSNTCLTKYVSTLGQFDNFMQVYLIKANRAFQSNICGISISLDKGRIPINSRWIFWKNRMFTLTDSRFFLVDSWGIGRGISVVNEGILLFLESSKKGDERKWHLVDHFQSMNQENEQLDTTKNTKINENMKN